jgi:hypothetical protein
MAGKMAGDKPPALRYKLNQYVERRDSSLYNRTFGIPLAGSIVLD